MFVVAPFDVPMMFARGVCSLVVALLVGGVLVGCGGGPEPITVEEVPRPEVPEMLRPASYDTVYTVADVDQRPTVDGGMANLMRTVSYPPAARAAGIQGRVFISFVVDTRGEATNITVSRSVHPLLDLQGLRAVESASFIPGSKNDTLVPVQMYVPVTFQLKTAPPQEGESER